MSYALEMQQFRAQPDQFWLQKAQNVPWFRTPTIAISQDYQGNDRWFEDGLINTCYAALDFHIEQGRGEQIALIYDSPITGIVDHYSYLRLHKEVVQTAAMLRRLGVGVGDRVVIYLPMIPQAAIAMLACARLGAIHSVVFGGFAAHELAVRIDDAEPKLLLTATGGIEPNKVIDYQPLLQKALSLSQQPPAQVVVWTREQIPATHHHAVWQALLDEADVALEPVALPAWHPLYILYTSGTTGKPKGVIRDHGGHAVALHYSMAALYNVQPGAVFWAASDVGWVVGHSYIVYAPLIFGCTSVLYEGKPVGTPDAGAFWRVVEQHRVNVLFAAPTAFRAIKKVDPEGLFCANADLSSLQTVFMAGERLDPATLEWAETIIKKPVVDHWWQTETGWAIAGNPLGLTRFDTKPGSASMPLPGYDVAILSPTGKACQVNEQGFIGIKRPLPPGCLVSLWRDQARFEQSYLRQFPGFYASGDGGYMDEEGYLFVMGRIDDVINVAGHRLSTGEMEAIVGAHPAVAECAVIGVADELKGQLPLGFVVLKDGESISDEALEAELIACVREQIGPIACFNKVLVVDKLPKTRSGKVLRATMRKIADGEQYSLPSTIDDASALDELEQRFRPG